MNLLGYLCLFLFLHLLNIAQAKSFAVNEKTFVTNKKSVLARVPITTWANTKHLDKEGQPTSWLKTMQLLRHRVKSCEKFTRNSTWNCFKEQSLELFDSAMSAKIVNLWHGVRFVRENNTKSENTYANELERKDLQHLTWFDRMAMSLAKTLTTHTLQINLKQITDAYMQSMERKASTANENMGDPVGTARLRRHRYNMLITMMFGATALGAVLVPMGFQLLSIVSGKALLLAKMALLLASINGLKRVANSGVHYGLYHVPGEHLGGYYDRGDTHHPRNVVPVPIQQNIEFGLK